MRFEARELKEYAEPVTPATLREGEVYFSVQFHDDKMLVPIMETFAYVGRNLDPDIDEDVEADGVGVEPFDFQDRESYDDGKPWDAEDPDVVLYVEPIDQLNHIFEYEKALEALMKSSLRRKRAGK